MPVQTASSAWLSQRGPLSCLGVVDDRLFNQGQVRTGARAQRCLDRTSNSNGSVINMSVQMVQARIKAERVTGVQAAAKKVFAAINAAQPEGIRYASGVLPDGETFVALLQVDDGVENPLPGFPEFREFLEGVVASRAEPANVQPLEVIGSYRLF
jgi:hypothetical protein